MSDSTIPPIPPLPPDSGSSTPPGPPVQPPEDQEDLLLWLLGELDPEEARRAQERWSAWPQEVERVRRFLSVTSQAGEEMRRQSARISAESSAAAPGADFETAPAVEITRPRTGAGLAAEARIDGAASEGFAFTGAHAQKRGIRGVGWRLRSLARMRVPGRFIPVALLAPVVAVLGLWLSTAPVFSPQVPRAAMLSTLTPTVQLFDQGNRIPSGAVGVNAQIRLLNPTAAVQLTWMSGRCQVVISGQATLLVTDENLGLMQQQGEAVYEVMARESPLRLLTAKGPVEISEARFRLTGSPPNLSYEILEGSVIEKFAGGQMISAPGRGFWGSSQLDFAGVMTASPGMPANPGEAGKSGQGTDAGKSGPNAEQNALDDDASATAALVLLSDASSTETMLQSCRHWLSGVVIRTDSTPVAGAIVTVGFHEFLDPWPLNVDFVTTATGTDGRFLFRHLPAAETTLLTVEHSSLVPEERYMPVELDRDDLEVILYDSSSISGRVIPAPGSEDEIYFRIEPLMVRTRTGDARAVALAEADQRSVRITTLEHTFEIAGLRAGTYRLRASTDDGQTGESEDIDLGLEQALAGVEIQLAPGGTLAGRVVDGGSQAGIASASVEVYRIAERRNGGRGGGGGGRDRARQAEQAPAGAGATSPDISRSRRPVSSALTDESGYYSISGLAPGRYELRAGADNYQELRRTVRIEAGQTANEIVPLFHEKGAVFGRVVDPEGDPLPEARITAEQTPDCLYDRMKAVTGPDGAYEIELNSGRWRVTAQAESDKASNASETIEILGPVRIQQDFVLFPGAKVYGTVTRRGTAVPNAQIAFRGNRFSRTIATDQKGGYEIRLRQGTYDIYVLGTRRATIRTEGKQSIRRNIAIGDNMIHGIVTDSATGAPINKAQVVLESVQKGAAARAYRTRTASNGFYEFASVDPGVFLLRASAEGYSESQQPDVTIPEGDETVLDLPISLTLAATILQINAIDAETGKPLSGVYASSVISADTGAPVMVIARPRVSDGTGLYLIVNLPEGRYIITFSRQGGGNYIPVTMRDVAVRPENENQLEVKMSRGGDLDLVVRRKPDREEEVALPIKGAHVRLIPSDAAVGTDKGIRLQGNTDIEGKITFRPLPVGNYSIEITANGMATEMRGVEILAGQRADLTIVMAPPPVSTP